MKDGIDQERVSFDTSSAIGRFGSGAVRLALLFGSVAIALALIAVPLLERKSGSLTARSRNIDYVNTGSIARGSTYTVRRSVLQRDPGAVCIIRGDGTLSGDCP